MVSRQRMALVLAASLILGLACAKPTKVIVKPGKVDLYQIDGTKSLSVSVLDQKDREMKKAKIEFQSSAPEVAAVDKNGLVTAKSSGEATITAKVGRISGSTSIAVKAIKEISLAPPESGVVGMAGTAVPLVVKAIDEKDEVVDITGATFQSSAPEVATVDNKGVLTLRTTGNTKIMANFGKATKDLSVNVEIEVPAAVKVENASQSVALGENQALEFTVLSNHGRPMTIQPTFSSSQPGVATVDAKGIVTGVSRGVAVIAISAGEARNEIKVTVR